MVIESVNDQPRGRYQTDGISALYDAQTMPLAILVNTDERIGYLCAQTGIKDPSVAVCIEGGVIQTGVVRRIGQCCRTKGISAVRNELADSIVAKLV